MKPNVVMQVMATGKTLPWSIRMKTKMKYIQLVLGLEISSGDSSGLPPPTAAKGGDWGADIVEGLPTKTPLVVKEWYNIRIEIKGTDIFLFGDSKSEGEKLKAKHVFKKKTAARGRLSLAAAGASLMYNHIKVTGPNVEDLFPVSPRDKLGDTWGELRKLTPVKR